MTMLFIVAGGGSYYIVSRNLGAEFGSAVGILFYLANTVATSMYLVGGVEVMLVGMQQEKCYDATAINFSFTSSLK